MFKQMQLENGVWAWGLSLLQYIQEAVLNCKSMRKKTCLNFVKLTCLAPNPFPIDYQPELEVAPEILPEHVSYYQSLMGI